KKMSKSKGNLITPQSYFDSVGADALRLFHLFVGPPGDDMDWTAQTDEVIDGCGRFLDRVWRLAVPDGAESDTPPGRHAEPGPEDVALQRATHRLVAKVTEDIERWSFNTAVAACQEFSNTMQRYRRQASGGLHQPSYAAAADALLLVLAPMTPHVAAEAWERRKGEGARIHGERWPTFDPELAKAETVTMIVQVDGKVRDRMEVDVEIDEAEARRLALSSPKVAQALDGGAPAQVIVRAPRLVNVVLPRT
ncbi:MAG TPA: class I tRNA ligase family protein, partial [Acidimicrobiales bacterium]|nr:class I tRNA ligase family protein [Acidimicrobiales bacterium]